MISHSIEASAATSNLLGGISATRLTVYDGVASDGQAGGSPHMHLACAEAYFVLAGTGAVEFVSMSGGFRRIPLSPGAGVQFEPGVVHRLVNDGGLEILVLMQNAGLPERGDAVFTFPPEDLVDPDRYAGFAQAPSVSAALERRNRAVRGLMALKETFGESRAAGTECLSAFHRAAVALVAPLVPQWQEVVSLGPDAEVARTRMRLTELEAAGPAFLASGTHKPLLDGDERIGMCGHLRQLLLPEGTSIPDGGQAAPDKPPSG